MEPLEIDASASIVNNMDMRDKIKGLLALGFLKKPSDDWYNELKTTINEIDNDLRPERNRMIHDSWHNTGRSEEHTSELQSLMRISYAVFCLKKKTKPNIK